MSNSFTQAEYSCAFKSVLAPGLGLAIHCSIKVLDDILSKIIYFYTKYLNTYVQMVSLLNNKKKDDLDWGLDPTKPWVDVFEKKAGLPY